MAGVGATLARDVPFSAIYWGSLEPIRRSLLPSDQGATAGEILAANCCAGGLGGAAAAAITTPLVLTLQQILAGQRHLVLAVTQPCMPSLDQQACGPGWGAGNRLDSGMQAQCAGHQHAHCLLPVLHPVTCQGVCSP